MLDSSLLQSYDSLPAGASGHWLGADVGRTHDKTALVQATSFQDALYIEEAVVLDKACYKS